MEYEAKKQIPEAIRTLKGLFRRGDKIQCESSKDLKRWALNLSAEGYGIGILGYHDLYDHVLTIMELPPEEENREVSHE